MNKEASCEESSLSQYIYHINYIHTTYVLHRLERLGLASCGIWLGILGILCFHSRIYFICVHSRASVLVFAISANDRFDLVCGHTICAYVVAIS